MSQNPKDIVLIVLDFLGADCRAVYAFDFSKRFPDLGNRDSISMTFIAMPQK
jgi:hypothetical protein